MSSPAPANPSGYFEDDPVRGPVAAIPAYAKAAVQPTVHGPRSSARHIAKTARSFYPVGSRVGLFGNICVGFRLLPTCLAALMADPTLLFVPLVVLFVGGIASAGYIAAFGGLAHLLSGGSGAAAVKSLPLTVVLAVVSVVGRAVVVADTTQCLHDAKPLIDMGWRLTVTRLPALIGLGVAQAAESTVTAASRSSAAGRVAANVTDEAWDFATFLAVPAILFEKVGPLAAVRRSGLLVASRWGYSADCPSGVVVRDCGLHDPTRGGRDRYRFRERRARDRFAGSDFAGRDRGEFGAEGNLVGGAVPLCYHRDAGSGIGRGRHVVGIRTALSRATGRCLAHASSSSRTPTGCLHRMCRVRAT